MMSGELFCCMLRFCAQVKIMVGTLLHRIAVGLFEG